MEKPVFELQGEYKAGTTDFANIVVEFFDSLADAEAFAEKNLEQYVIHMRMKLAEKRRSQ